MKTLTRETPSFPARVTVAERGRMKNLTKKIRALPERAFFWVGVLLFSSGALKIEDIPE